MKNILGIHTGHNSTATLLQDGKIIQCISEERFNRKKNYNGFPTEAVRQTMHNQNIKAEDIDGVAISGTLPTAFLFPTTPGLNKNFGAFTKFKRSVAALETKIPALRAVSELYLNKIVPKHEAAIAKSADSAMAAAIGIDQTKVLLTYRLVPSHANAISTVHRGILAAWPEDAGISVDVFASPDEVLKPARGIHLLQANTLPSLMWQCVRLFRKSDIVWYIAGDPKALLLFWIGRMFNPRLRWMCTVHGSYTVRTKEASTQSSIKRLLSFFSLYFGIRTVIKKTHKIVCVSKYVREDLMKHFPDVPAKNFIVIPNAVYPSSIREDTTFKNPHIFGFTKLQPTMVFVGRAAKHKRIPLIFELAKRLTNINFLVVTTAPIPGCLESENIHYKINASASTINQVYENADGFIFPSLDEGFGLVIIEAMSKGVPVIATQHAGIQDIIESPVNGILIPNDEHELEGFCNAILRITADTSVSNRLRLEGLRTVKTRFVWPIVAKEYANLIIQLDKKPNNAHS